ncbi:MAG: hypoxanthine phosphoribosyltransferase [Acidobacteriota bacterium]|nr:hypoxanthine phosphoribosyltransferase [Acidobacteriota bacterium]
MPIDYVLLTAGQIQVRVRELAADLERNAREPIHLVGVLKGAFVFLADLVRAMEGPVTVDFLAAASYRSGTVSSGEVELVRDLDATVTGRDVVLVEDIVDTGLTLQVLQQVVRSRAPRSLRTVTLLDKPSRRQVPVDVDCVGFTIPDCFVVGYGLDFDERYRNLPDIRVLTP